MVKKVALAALGLGLASSTSAFAVDGDPVVARHDGRQQRGRHQARRGVQRVAEGLQGRRRLQGLLSGHDECRHRRVPGRQRAAHPAGLRGRHRDHDGRQGRHQAGLPADGGGRRDVRPEGLPAGDHRLLLDRQGRDAVLPVQLVLDGDVDQQGRPEEGQCRDPEDLAGGVRGGQEAQGGGLRDLRLHGRLDDLGDASSSSPPGTTCRSPPRRTGSTGSTPS